MSTKPPPPTLLGLPIRTDATLTEPGEIWLEQPDGTATRIFPALEPNPRDRAKD